MLCFLDKYSALSNFSDSFVSCQASGIMYNFLYLKKIYIYILKQKDKICGELTGGGLVINGANPSS